MDYKLWIQHISTPYLPVVGLVHPDCVKLNTLQSVLDSLQTGNRPGFDKSNRWSSRHAERLANDNFQQTDKATIIYTRINQKLRAYIYSIKKTSLDAIISQVTEQGAREVYFFSPLSGHSPDIHISHSYLGEVKEIGDDNSAISIVDEKSADALREIDNGEEMAGFGFLASQILIKADIGLTFGYFQNGNLIGAIGPLDIRSDSNCRLQLLPPYFGVQRDVRGTGVGRALWETAMRYAVSKGATYVLLQAEDGATSDGFYRKAGLRPLGSICIRREVNPLSQ